MNTASGTGIQNLQCGAKNTKTNSECNFLTVSKTGCCWSASAPSGGVLRISEELWEFMSSWGDRRTLFSFSSASIFWESWWVLSSTLLLLYFSDKNSQVGRGTWQKLPHCNGSQGHFFHIQAKGKPEAKGIWCPDQNREQHPRNGLVPLRSP